MSNTMLDTLPTSLLATSTGGMKYGPNDRESGNVIDMRPGHVTDEDRRRQAAPVTPIKPDPKAFEDVFGHKFPTAKELRDHPLK